MNLWNGMNVEKVHSEKSTMFREQRIVDWVIIIVKMNKLYYRAIREFEQEAIYFLVCDTPVNMMFESVQCALCTLTSS